MFLSIAIDPDSFAFDDSRPSSAANSNPDKDEDELLKLRRKLHAQNAYSLLKRVIRNGVLICREETVFHKLAGSISKLGDQFLNILFQDIAKERKKYLANKADFEPKGWGKYEDLVGVSAAMDADLIVCANERDREQIEEQIGRAGLEIEVCVLRDYSHSKASRKGEGFLQQNVHIGQMDSPDRDQYILRVIRYAKSLVVADPMIGKGIENGYLPDGETLKSQSQTDKFVNGIAHIAGLWKKESPYSGDDDTELEITVVTKVQKVKTEDVRKKLYDMLEVALGGDACKFKFELIRDPDSFHARFLLAKGRCMAIDPGYDRVGWKKKNDLQFQPDSTANMRALSNIRGASNEVDENQLTSLSSIN